MSSQEPSGFLQSTSAFSDPNAAILMATTFLPVPRVHTLRPGSSKETAFVNHVDKKLLEISGRYERRFNNDLDIGHPSRGFNTVCVMESNTGYQSFADVAKDLVAVIDVVWVCGTRRSLLSFLQNVEG